MNRKPFYRISDLAILDVEGNDAGQILHNLTTNDVKTLTVSQDDQQADVSVGCETFVTDVRGKTLGHVYAFRTSAGYRLIGAAGQSEAIASHADKYTIREDAVPKKQDADFAAVVLPPTLLQTEANGIVAEIKSKHAGVIATLESQTPPVGKVMRAFQVSCPSDSTNDALLIDVTAYEVDWLGDGSLLLLVSAENAASFIHQLTNASLVAEGDDAFHQQRVLAGFPWYGIDLSDKNLPQEADRDATTISFTKGCYLGQETVARLDALGQVQKKLVRWSIDHGNIDAGTELVAIEKVVGRLSSVASTASNKSVAIGMARRSHFESGATATGTTSDGLNFNATVMA
ncbi:MAG: aminomethyltransferase [Pirellulaceae bacterium]